MPLVFSKALRIRALLRIQRLALRILWWGLACSTFLELVNLPFSESLWVFDFSLLAGAADILTILGLWLNGRARGCGSMIFPRKDAPLLLWLAQQLPCLAASRQ